MKRLILCLTLYSYVVRAGEPEKMLDTLRSELRAEVKSKQESGKEEERSRYSLVESVLAQVSTATFLNDEHLLQTIQMLEQIRTSSTSDKVSETCGALIKELRERGESRVKALKEKIDTTLRTALATGLNTKTAKDLDAPILELNRLQKEISVLSSRSEGRPRFNTDAISAVEQILIAIQDVMISASNPQLKRTRESVQKLQSIATNCSRQVGDLIPRSELIEKMQAVVERIFPDLPQKILTQQEFEKQLKEMVSGVKTLDEMDGIFIKMDAIIAHQRELNSYLSDTSFTAQLRSYRKIYENLNKDVTTSMSFAASATTSQGMETLNPIKELLVKFGLTRVLGTSGDLAPKQDENVSAYLRRALEISRQTSNWQMMYRVIESAQMMNITSIANVSDMTALKQLLAGVNLERARQFSGATSAYLAALKSGSLVIPAEIVGDMLEKLQKEHPQEYENGVQLSISVPFNVDDRLLKIYDNSRSATYPTGTMNPATQPAVTNTLTIPTVSKEIPNDVPTKGADPKASTPEPAKNEKKPE